ncbi:MAG: cytochrome c biogenesis protein CcdA [Anaerolineales bacterium]
MGCWGDVHPPNTPIFGFLSQVPQRSLDESQWQGDNRNGWLSSVLMGVFFAAGWSPCIGATLGAILTLGFSEQTSGQAMVLTSGYALGLGIPFLAIGLGMERAAGFVHRFQRHLRKVQIASGLLLLVIGIMLLTNQLTLIAIWAQRNGLFLDLPLGAAATPTYLIAILAGLISFLSPCVLPLVPGLSVPHPKFSTSFYPARFLPAK